MLANWFVLSSPTTAEPSLTNAFFRLWAELWVPLHATLFMGHPEEKFFIYFTCETQPEVTAYVKEDIHLNWKWTHGDIRFLKDPLTHWELNFIGNHPSPWCADLHHPALNTAWKIGEQLQPILENILPWKTSFWKPPLRAIRLLPSLVILLIRTKLHGKELDSEQETYPELLWQMLPQIVVLDPAPLCFPACHISFQATKCSYTSKIIPAQCPRVNSTAQVLCQLCTQMHPESQMYKVG